MLRTEIRNHLKDKGSITRLEALGLYGCMDITTVIRDLRRGNRTHKAMKINSVIRMDHNGKRYARYTVTNRRKASALR